MKTRNLLLVFIVLATISCNHDKDHFITEVEEVPGDVTNLQLCETLYSNIINLFKEGKNNMNKYPALFAKDIEQKIVLTKETEIFVTFVGEGAGQSNVLGWYAYKESETPSIHADLKNQIIFPHISNAVLSAGDTRQLSIGKFEAGTVIGFYVVVGGWNNKSSIVDFRKRIIYTDAVLNKDGAKQNLLFKEKQCNDIIVGFEDLELSASDYDFNDILFKVSDNNQNAISASFDVQFITVL